MLQSSSYEVCEDQLRVALIQPGDSVIVEKKAGGTRVYFMRQAARRVEPRVCNSSLPGDYRLGRGVFCVRETFLQRPFGADAAEQAAQGNLKNVAGNLILPCGNGGLQ